MSVAYGHVPASMDQQFSRTMKSTKGVKMTVTKEGSVIGFRERRKGAHQPKKARNRK